jgi:hypothetical protein
MQMRRSPLRSQARDPSRSPAALGAAFAVVATVFLGIGPASAQAVPGAPAVREEPLPAPIGHRQPRAQDLPPRVLRDEGSINPDTDFDRKLDAEICRGC